MHNFTRVLRFLCVLATAAAFSQQSDPGKISANQTIADYFRMDREGVLLHLNKSTYISGETVWLTGYLINKQTHAIYPETTNVYVTLLDAEGKKVGSQLIYSDNGLLEGFISIPMPTATGQYYVQAFTNYMNNFSEDESTVYPITILNRSTAAFADVTAVDLDSAQFSFFPESGVFLNAAPNVVAFRIADCYGNGIRIDNGSVLDENGKTVAQLTSDTHGYGRFELADTQMQQYKARAVINDREVSGLLPRPSVTGICFSVNNYIFPDKATVTLKTNAATMKQFSQSNLSFIIQQYDRVTTAQFEFKPNEPKQSFAIPMENFSDGLNSIFLVDQNRNKIAERLVFKPLPKLQPTQLLVNQKRGDSIVVSGLSALKLASLSISVLPAEAKTTGNDLLAMSELAALEPRLGLDGRYYLNEINRKKQFELDNLLITKTVKYQWKDIGGEAPTERFPFDHGITITGTINNQLNDRDKTRIRLSAFDYGLDENTSVNEKNEFVFERLRAIDSATVFFSLFDKKDRLSELKLYTQISGSPRQFLKTFRPKEADCAPKPFDRHSDFAKMFSVIYLDTVQIKAPKKPQLDPENSRRYNNNSARGYKISATDVGMYGTVVDFIQNHGFAVTQYAGRVVISRNYSTSFFASNAPAIYVDDMLIDDQSMLTTYRMNMIDEIYINKSGFGGGQTGSAGIIRIYTKKNFGAGSRSFAVKSKGIIVKNGFQQWRRYRNPDYDNYSGALFKEFGTIHWISSVGTDAAGAFRFSFPNFYQENVKVVIEGIATDGTVNSEVILLNVGE